METIDLLNELGMSAAAKNVTDKLELQRKLFTAYQNFQFVSPEALDKFNENLRKKTEVIIDKNTGEIKKEIDPTKYQTVHYDKVILSKLKDYKDVPPVEVLRKVKEAMALNCFDTYEVAKIESIQEVVDPIIFGVINGCSDKFYIAQWDNDVKFEDIAKEMGNVI